MERESLLQSFAIAKNGDVVSVNEVQRGQACDCTCPSCKAPVIARHGDVRVWHFAHASETDCPGGAESALHLAAKQLIARQGGVMLPPLKIRRTVRTNDGRQGSGEASMPETWVDFDDVKTEVPFGDVIPDVVGYAEGSIYLVEIGVSHFVDAEKLARLQQLGLPSIEVDLSRFERETWDWDSLEQAVVCQATRRTDPLTTSGIDPLG
jgi:competence protein CoiA-like protein